MKQQPLNLLQRGKPKQSSDLTRQVVANREPKIHFRDIFTHNLDIFNSANAKAVDPPKEYPTTPMRSPSTRSKRNEAGSRSATTR